MTDIQFKTNLDEAQREVGFLGLGDYVPQVPPPIGSKIRFTLHNGKHYDLEVVNVTYDVKHDAQLVELHIPSHLGMSIKDWMEHMRRLRG